MKHLVKLNFLILGLGLTVYIIYGLNTRGLPPGLQTLFGLQGAQTTAQSVFNFSWCHTRVSSMIKPEVFKLSQEGRNWLLSSPAEKVVDFVTVEKWFGRHCSVPAKRLEVTTGEGFTPVLLVKFVTDEVEVLKKNAKGQFAWGNTVFESPELAAALEEIPSLPDGSKR